MSQKARIKRLTRDLRWRGKGPNATGMFSLARAVGCRWRTLVRAMCRQEQKHGVELGWRKYQAQEMARIGRLK